MDIDVIINASELDQLAPPINVLRKHFHDIEPEIKPHWIWIGSQANYLQDSRFHNFGLDLCILSQSELGYGPAMNRLISMARSAYLLSIRPGWEFNNPNRNPFVRHAIEAMETDSNIAQINLDNQSFLNFDDRTIYDGPFCSRKNSPPLYIQNPETTLGGFLQGPAICRAESLRSIRPFQENDALTDEQVEFEFASRFHTRFVSAKSPEMLLFRKCSENAPAAPTSPATAKATLTPPISFIVTGCGRSGTGYASKLLSSAGITCGHEDFLNEHSTPSHPITATTGIPSSLWGDSSWLAAPFIEYLPKDTAILHQVRNPVEVIRSFMGIGFFNNTSNRPHAAFALQHLVETHPNPLIQSMLYWLRWNQLVQNNARRSDSRYYLYRLEDLSQPETGCLSKIMQLIGRPMSPQECMDMIRAIPSNYNARQRDHAITWHSLPKGDLKQAILDQAITYGYSLQDLVDA